jgi:hypothetical protein
MISVAVSSTQNFGGDQVLIEKDIDTQVHLVQIIQQILTGSPLTV